MKIVDLNVIRKNALKNIDNYFVVKSNAYGLGFNEIMDVLLEVGVKRFASSDLIECVNIRKKAPDVYILKMGELSNIDTYRKYDITPTITSIDDLYKLENIKAELKINTGMNRFGIEPSEYDLVINYAKKRGIDIVGMYSHIASYESYDEQRSLFDYITKDYSGIKHINSSRFSDRGIRRIGMEIYENSLLVTSNIVKIKTIKKGSYIGYNLKADRNMKIGIIDIGYYEGLSYLNINRFVYIDGIYSRIVNICMNNSLIELPYEIEKREVEIMGPHINCKAISNKTGINSYEVFSSFRNMITRYEG